MNKLLVHANFIKTDITEIMIHLLKQINKLKGPFRLVLFHQNTPKSIKSKFKILRWMGRGEVQLKTTKKKPLHLPRFPHNSPKKLNI